MDGSHDHAVTSSRGHLITRCHDLRSDGPMARAVMIAGCCCSSAIHPYLQRACHLLTYVDLSQFLFAHTLYCVQHHSIPIRTYYGGAVTPGAHHRAMGPQ